MNTTVFFAILLFSSVLNHYCALVIESPEENEKEIYMSKKEAHFAVPAVIPMLSRHLGRWNWQRVGGVGWVTDWCFQDGGRDKSISESLWVFVKKRLEKKKEKKKGKLNEYDGITGIEMKVN